QVFLEIVSVVNGNILYLEASKARSQNSLRDLPSVFLGGVFPIFAGESRAVSGVGLFDITLQRTVRQEFYLGGTLEHVGFRRTDRQMNELASVVGDQQGKAVLLVIRELAEGNQLIGRIEDEHMAKLDIFINGRHRFRITCGRKFDRKNGVIEACVRRS